MDDNGKLVAWQNTYVDKHEPVEAPIIPYAAESFDIGHVSSSTHVPFGAWRSVDHSQHGFFTESFIDEVAHAAGQDPFAYRAELLKGKPGLAFEKLSAISEGVLPRRVRDLVYKGFSKEAMLRMVDTAPGTKRDMGRTANVSNIKRLGGIGNNRRLDRLVLVDVGVLPGD